MAQSYIEWTDMTWNPTTGCTKISAGCKNCYAEVMSKRLQAMGIEKYSAGFSLAIHHDALQIPYSWKQPKTVFVNSMSDLFHKNIPFDFIERVFDVMNDNPQHVFQVLTKRSDQLLKYNGKLQWGANIWMGVSVEDSKVIGRVDDLRRCGAKVKFLSCEPLIGPLNNLNLEGIDWVIVGGESGRKPRVMQEDWLVDILNQCRKSNVKFFFKQWGGTNKKKNGRILLKKTWDEMPSRALLAC
jgi:protein gp37